MHSSPTATGAHGEVWLGVWHLEAMLLSDGRSLALRCRMNLSRLSTWGRSFSAVDACAGRMSCTASWVRAQLRQVTGSHDHAGTPCSAAPQRCKALGDSETHSSRLAPAMHSCEAFQNMPGLGAPELQPRSVAPTAQSQITGSHGTQPPAVPAQARWAAVTAETAPGQHRLHTLSCRPGQEGLKT